MRKQFYAHVVYDNPDVYDYEYIIDSSDYQYFSKEVFSILENQYDEVRYREEMNVIDIEAWEDFLETNKINYENDGWCPHEAIWNYLKVELLNSINGSESKEDKYKVLEYTINEVVRLIQDANLEDGGFSFYIEIFNDSRSFAKYFFPYLKDSTYFKYGLDILTGRLDCIISSINDKDFPNNDFQEGILYEWLNIFELIND